VCLCCHGQSLICTFWQVALKEKGINDMIDEARKQDEAEKKAAKAQAPSSS